ncbi:MAG: ComEA family DNA-binding protein [Chloroflexi bacterium]|nr:ComEA family DNA-binding protein [Chloroflexota bacterium]
MGQAWRTFAATLIVTLLLVGVMLFLYKRPAPGAVELHPVAAAPVSSPTPKQIAAYISGAVLHPDVYTLAEGARLKDLVTLAGGLLPDADTAAINLALPLSDGQHFHIFRQGEVGSPSPPPATGSNPNPPAGQAQPIGKINLNTATASELDSLPGIGPAIAQRIIDYRTKNGPFKSIEEIKQVSGIGDAIFENLKDRITAP